MNDMSQVIIPRSDQWNADDFLSGPQTFKITDVKIRGGHEQPVSISVEGSEKVFRPCKSMSRVLVACWGPDASKYLGRSLTLYTDPSVIWGGMKVGGIRISNLSDIKAPVTMALTATKGSRKPFTVQPLATPPAHHPVAFVHFDAGDKAAHDGMDALRKFWTGLTKAERAAVGNGAQLAAWKAIAEAADAPEVEFDESPHDSPAPGAATESSERVVVQASTLGEAAHGPLEGAAVPAPGAAAPSERDLALSAFSEGERKLRAAEIRKDGAARAAAGTGPLTDYLEDLRRMRESDLVSPTLASYWHEIAKEVDAKGRK